AVLDSGRIVEMGPVAEVFLHPQHPTSRRFVFESENQDEQELHDDYRHVPGRILRPTFHGEATYTPLLGTVARETGVDYSILSGRIDRIKDVPYGQLTIALIGGDYDAAFKRFSAADVHVEEVRWCTNSSPTSTGPISGRQHSTPSIWSAAPWYLPFCSAYPWGYCCF